jgi:hypothetical protein
VTQLVATKVQGIQTAQHYKVAPILFRAPGDEKDNNKMVGALGSAGNAEMFVWDLETVDESPAGQGHFENYGAIAIDQLSIRFGNEHLVRRNLCIRGAFRRAWNDVVAFVEEWSAKPVLVSHNSACDTLVLHLALHKADIDTDSLSTWSFACSIKDIFRPLMPALPSYSLENLCEELNVENAQPHDAGSDTQGLSELIEKVSESQGPRLHALVETAAKPLSQCAILADGSPMLPLKPGHCYWKRSNSHVYHVALCRHLGSIGDTSEIVCDRTAPANRSLCTACAKITTPDGRVGTSTSSLSTPCEYMTLRTRAVYHVSRECRHVQKSLARMCVSTRRPPKKRLCRTCKGIASRDQAMSIVARQVLTEESKRRPVNSDVYLSLPGSRKYHLAAVAGKCKGIESIRDLSRLVGSAVPPPNKDICSWYRKLSVDSDVYLSLPYSSKYHLAAVAGECKGIESIRDLSRLVGSAVPPPNKDICGFCRKL